MISGFFQGQILWASIIAYALCFILTFIFLINQKINLLECLTLSLVTMFSGITLYEIVYHYGYGFGTIEGDFTRVALQSSGIYQPLIFFSTVTLAPLLAWRYIKQLKPFIIMIVISAVIFWFWEVTGYAQFADPQWWPDQTPLIWLLPQSYVHAPTLDAHAAIVSLGFWMNSFSKILAIAPAFLFFPKGGLTLKRTNAHRQPYQSTGGEMLPTPSSGCRI